MPVPKFFVFAILTVLAHLGVAQEKPVAPRGKQYSIPFELTDDNVITIRAILNKQDTLMLMFHTAASALTLTEEAIKKLKTVEFSRTDTVTSWGGGGQASRFSPHNTLQIGELQWDDVSIWENIHSGRGTDGKFGLDLFQHKAVEIDFDSQRLVLHTTLPRKTRQYEKLALSYKKELMFVEAACKTGDTLLSHQFLVHTGYSGAVLLDDIFVAENKLGGKLPIVGEKVLKDSYGNVLKTKKAILTAFIIGKQQLPAAPAGFFEGAIGRQKMSIIGVDILKRFHLIIDAQRTYIYLKPNSLKKAGYMNV